MLRYPGLPHRVRNEDELNDESLSEWLSKVLYLLNSIKLVLTSGRISRSLAKMEDMV